MCCGVCCGVFCIAVCRNPNLLFLSIQRYLTQDAEIINRLQGDPETPYMIGATLKEQNEMLFKISIAQQSMKRKAEENDVLHRTESDAHFSKLEKRFEATETLLLSENTFLKSQVDKLTRKCAALNTPTRRSPRRQVMEELQLEEELEARASKARHCEVVPTNLSISNSSFGHGTIIFNGPTKEIINVDTPPPAKLPVRSVEDELEMNRHADYGEDGQITLGDLFKKLHREGYFRDRSMPYYCSNFPCPASCKNVAWAYHQTMELLNYSCSEAQREVLANPVPDLLSADDLKFYVELRDSCMNTMLRLESKDPELELQLEKKRPGKNMVASVGVLGHRMRTYKKIIDPQTSNAMKVRLCEPEDIAKKTGTPEGNTSIRSHFAVNRYAIKEY